MQYEKIIVSECVDHVSCITLNRPEKMNSFDSALAQELYSAFMELDAFDEARVVLIKGAGRNFCAGIDLSEHGNKTVMEYREWVEVMERPLYAISRMKKTVIAQVHGVAAANGLGLAASADLCIAGDDSRFGLTAINVGLNCVGPVLPVVRCVGRKKALELLLSGVLMNATEALAMGLVNRVVPAEELEDQAMAWALELAGKSPLAQQMAKAAFYMAEDMEYEKQFAFMNESFARLCSSHDASEGVTAFFEKRIPVWTGK